MEINTKKMVYSLFNNGRTNLKQEIVLKINDVQLKLDKKLNYLGVKLDQKVHIYNFLLDLYSQANAKLNLVKKLVCTNWGIE